ncbi:MAG: hypothetical protein K0R80_2434 [Clostridia bacterium]|jgi:hypothetical protein|nr:hypothetical protein [Clostridia bacterium]
MNNCIIEFTKNLAIIFTSNGAIDTDPYEEFIDFLYMDRERIDFIFNTTGNLSQLYYDYDTKFKTPAVMAKLITSIYNINDNHTWSDELKMRILADLKESQNYFYEKAHIFLDENPPLNYESFKLLSPKERYAKETPIETSIRCNLQIDEDTGEIIERYYPESLFEACYILFIKAILSNSTIKRCAHCGKYFKKRLGYNNEYCTRLVPGKNKTCRDIGAMQKYRSESMDDIQRIFTKYYKKVFSYCKRKKINYSSWLIRASNLRDIAKSTNMDIEQFEDELKKIEDEEIYIGG